MPPIILKPPATATKRRQRTYIPRFKRMEDFMKWQPEDGYKYEWNDGVIEKKFKIKQLEFAILARLQRFFYNTIYFAQGDTLITEGDIKTSSIQLRRPDLAYYTAKQIAQCALGIWAIPTFIIEFVSPTDTYQAVYAKNKEYFKAGVMVIWHVNIQLREVHIYTTTTAQIAANNSDLCTAAPALPDFAITIEELFGE